LNIPKSKGASNLSNRFSQNAQKETEDFMKRQEPITGVGFGKTSMKNDDICDELVLSNKDMRFDQLQKDREQEAESRRLKDEEDDALMREADAVLA
jgi:hypothetical protein